MNQDNKVTVVVPHYWDVRNGNLRILIHALNNGTCRPKTILIWNNGHPLTEIFPTNVKVINWPWNVGCKARFVAALCADTEFILFQDNDVRVESHTLDRMLDWYTADSVLALEGRKLIPGRPYEECQFINGHDLHRELAVDISIGRLELTRRSVVQRCLKWFPFEPSTIMDDIWFSYAAQQEGIPRVVMPCSPNGDGFVNLDQGGVGAYRSPSHMPERDKLCQRLFPLSRFTDDEKQRLFPLPASEKA